MSTSAVATNRWVTRFRPLHNPRIRLFCIPYAGGGPQIFQKWTDYLPADVEICSLLLPGRGKRLMDPAFRELMPLVEEATEAVLPLVDVPYAFFGHSMGALVGFELARGLRKRGCKPPLHLFVSGCFAAHIPDPHPMHHLPEKEFVDQVRSLNGVPQEVLENEELMELILPSLRADFTATETYLHREEPPLTCPITAFAGSRDPLATKEFVEEWRIHTTARFTTRVLPGDHFFLHSQQPLLLSMIAAELRSA